MEKEDTDSDDMSYDLMSFLVRNNKIIEHYICITSHMCITCYSELFEFG